MKQSEKRRQWRFPDVSWPAAIMLYSVFIGFLMTAGPRASWDDHLRIPLSHWLLGMFGLGPDVPMPKNYIYSPLWETFLATANRYVFTWMHDELWVRHALSFALLPAGGTLLYRMLRKEGVSQWGALLALIGCTGYVRFIGHATMNVKDAPAAVFMLVKALNTLKRTKPAPASAPTTKDCKFCCSTIPIKAVRCPNCTSQL